jgi:serine/threonine protein phosphatase 1
MKTYVCGDIHGCFQELMNLLNIVEPMNLEENRVVFVGDYIDRGPGSFAVVEYLMGLEERFGKDHVVCLRGNHEDMCLHFYGDYENNSRQYANAWHINGAIETLESYPDEEVLQTHREWFKNLRLRFEDDEFHYVHAGFCPGIDPEYQTNDDMMWIRYNFIQDEQDWGKKVIFGHTSFKGVPLIMDNKIGLDTACVYGYKLTCMRMDNQQTWQVEGYSK